MAITGGIFSGANQAIDANRENALNQQQLGLQERAMDERVQRADQQRARQLFQDNQKVVGGLIEASLQANKPPEQIAQLISPLLESARKVLDPQSMLQLENLARAKLQGPTAQQQASAQAQNTAAGNKVLAQNDPVTRAKLAQSRASTAASNRSNRGSTGKLTGIANKISGVRRLISDGTLTEEQGAKAIQDMLDGLGGKANKKAEMKASEALAKRNATLRSAITKAKFFDSVATDAVEQSKATESDVIGSQGFAGMIAQFFPGTDARKLGNTLDTLRANIGFDKLQEMRANSPTGGALGQVSNLENMLLQATSGKIDQFETPQQLQDQIIKIKNLQKSYLLGTLLEHHIANSFDDNQKAVAMQALDALSAGEEAVGIANKFKEMTGFDPFSGV